MKIKLPIILIFYDKDYFDDNEIGINNFVYDFAWIKSLSRLVKSQITKVCERKSFVNFFGIGSVSSYFLFNNKHFLKKISVGSCAKSVILFHFIRFLFIVNFKFFPIRDASYWTTSF